MIIQDRKKEDYKENDHYYCLKVYGNMISLWKIKIRSLYNEKAACIISNVLIGDIQVNFHQNIACNELAPTFDDILEEIKFYDLYKHTIRSIFHKGL